MLTKFCTNSVPRMEGLEPVRCTFNFSKYTLPCRAELIMYQAEAMQTALQLDSLRASHPIEVPVRDALEVDQIFDHISYQKGSSVIRMLGNHLGDKTFLQGVAAYLKQHAYGEFVIPERINTEHWILTKFWPGNATTDDLWSALSEASGQDVKSFMVSNIIRIRPRRSSVTDVCRIHGFGKLAFQWSPWRKSPAKLPYSNPDF